MHLRILWNKYYSNYVRRRELYWHRLQWHNKRFCSFSYFWFHTWIKIYLTARYGTRKVQQAGFWLYKDNTYNEREKKVLFNYVLRLNHYQIWFTFMKNAYFTSLHCWQKPQVNRTNPFVTELQRSTASFFLVNSENQFRKTTYLAHKKQVWFLPSFSSVSSFRVTLWLLH